jgi:hypothetical protein
MEPNGAEILQGDENEGFNDFVLPDGRPTRRPDAFKLRVVLPLVGTEFRADQREEQREAQDGTKCPKTARSAPNQLGFRMRGIGLRKPDRPEKTRCPKSGASSPNPFVCRILPATPLLPGF